MLKRIAPFIFWLALTGIANAYSYPSTTCSNDGAHANVYNVTTNLWSCVAIGVIGHQETIGITADGGSTSPVTGVKGYFTVPYNGTITGWVMESNASGSAVFDVWKTNAAIPTVANTIDASALPTLSSQQYVSSTTLTGWTTSVSAGDVFGYNLNSASTLTRVTLQINITATQ